MRTKEEHYELVKKLRKIVADPAYRKCPCPKTRCEWHGRCADCVTLHRYAKDHVPNCFQQFINDKIKALAAVGELTVSEKEQTPAEYWDYVKSRDETAS